MDDTQERRAAFWKKVLITNDCWIWNGYESYGYGIFRGRRAHREAYELLVGPIQQGLEIDHLCRVLRCINPAHLEAVTHKENVARGMSPAAIAARENRCAKGLHEFTPENTIYQATGRRCRACTKERDARWWIKKKATTAG